MYKKKGLERIWGKNLQVTPRGHGEGQPHVSSQATTLPLGFIVLTVFFGSFNFISILLLNNALSVLKNGYVNVYIYMCIFFCMKSRWHRLLQNGVTHRHVRGTHNLLVGSRLTFLK